ncbi:MAG: FAD binding domain-containing protein [Bacillota bacterium]
MLKDYLLPASVDEALQNLQAYSGKAAIIAGGTDIMVNMAEGKVSPEALIDISRIGEFKQIEEEGEFIKLGAGVTHTQAARSPLIREKALVLAQACREVGSLQIRNVGTLVGNVSG